MNRLSVSLEARADLREIWKYVARDNPSAANSLRSRLQDVFLFFCSAAIRSWGRRATTSDPDCDSSVSKAT